MDIIRNMALIGTRDTPQRHTMRHWMHMVYQRSIGRAFCVNGRNHGADEMKTIGNWGESIAADFLRKNGYEIVVQGYRSRYGEIDLIAQDAAYLAFVEVKTRKSAHFSEAREAVSPSKMHKLRQTAEIYLSLHETERQPRFDVIEIYAPQGVHTKRPEILHLEDAFQ